MTPFGDIAVDKYLRVTGTQDRSRLTFRPDSPQNVKLAAGIVTWEEPKQKDNITDYIIRVSKDVVAAVVPVGQVSAPGINAIQVFVSAYNRASGLESIQASNVGTGVPSAGISGDAWAPFTPTTTNLTSVTITLARGIKGGKTALFRMEVQGTSNGTNPTFALPYAPLDAHQTAACTITDVGAGATVSGRVVFVGSTVSVGLYNNSALAAATVYRFVIQGQYELA